VRRELPRIPQFGPDLLVWYYGFDTHADDYGSIGLTEPAFFEICDLMLFVSGELGIPLQVVLGGGSISYLALNTIPEIVKRLAQD
jgi:acetoin utilization deacetylase AcuC-like enzyme